MKFNIRVVCHPIYEKMSIIFIFFISFPYLQAFADWKWINPYPQGNQLNDIIMINKQTGLAVGNFGTLLKTSNSGKDWIIDTLGVTNNLLSISFSDSFNGWICGDSAIILKTTDGGLNWERQICDLNLKLSSISALDDNNVVAAGDSGSVVKTTNGGITWQPINFGEKNNLISIRFINSDKIYISSINSKFFKTTDSGLNWTTKIVTSSVNTHKMSFTDKSHGYIAGDYGTIFYTTDEGDVWSAINCGVSQNLYDIKFIASTIGITVGSQGSILMSSDSGKSWNNLSLNSGPDINSVVLSNDSTIFAVCSNASIIYSNDTGHHWMNTIKTIKNNNFMSVFFIDSLTGWTGSDSLFKTTDGGQNWSFVKTGYDDVIGEIKTVIFLDTMNGLLGCNKRYSSGGLILRTYDGGVTWKGASIPCKLNGLTAIDKNNIYFCGERSSKTFDKIVGKSIDGGLTWEVKAYTDLLSYRFDDIAFSDSLNGFAGTQNGYFFTTDGGNTWLSQTLADKYIYKIFFLNHKMGWMVGTCISSQSKSYNVFLKTTDGGITWSESYVFNKSIMPKDMVFLDNKNGYILGYYVLIKTTDGGDSWRMENIPTNQTLNAISFPRETNGYVVGDKGMILKYTGQKPEEVFEEFNKSFDFISLFPNPAGDFITISVGAQHTVPESIKIFDVFGQEEHPPTPSYEEGELRIDVSSLSTGVYFVRMGNKVQKFVKVNR